MARTIQTLRLHSLSDSHLDTRTIPRVEDGDVEEAPPARRRWVLWTVLTVFLGLVVTLGVASLAAYQFGRQPVRADSSSTVPAPGPPPATADVKLTACQKVREYHSGAVTLDVTNHTNATASYVIAVAFQSRDGRIRYDLASMTVPYLGAGQSTTVKSNGVVLLPDGFTCKTVAINRQAVQPWTSSNK